MADPFQPKFVDLVRNYSTTVGTGDFVLGPAVNGHSSMATALTIGDQFYYSAIGIDKPAEREIGRGQLLADGTISRTPVSGPKTSFTAGNKAIALIAAAEWFTAIQAGGSGSSAAVASAEQAAISASESAAGATSANAASAAAQTARAGAESAKTAAETAKAGADQAQSGAQQAEAGAQQAEAGAQQAEAGAEAARDTAVAASASGGGLTVVSNRAELAALTSTTQPALLTEAGRVGVFVWSSANQSANVTLDTYQGVYVAPTTDPTGASGAWVRQYEGDVQLSWFGVADGAATNAARVESAIALFGARAATFQFPKGKIAIDSPIDVNRPVHIRGHGPSNYSAVANAATILEFPAGVTGFDFNHVGGAAGAQGAKLSDLAIYQPTRLATTGTGSHNPASPSVITLSAAGDFANGQVVALEGAGISRLVIGKTAAITSGTNTVTVSITTPGPAGSAGNPGVYVGQHIIIAGAGVAGADLLTTVTAWNSTTITLAASASTTVTAAAYTVKCPAIGKIASGGGTTTLTLDQALTNTQSVTNAVLRHADAAIYASCTLHTDRLTASNFPIGMVGHGQTTGGAIFDSGTFHNSIFGADWIGVALQGPDANANSFTGCNFAGPRVGVLDASLLGNDFTSCHWAFNVGIIVALVNAQTRIIGGYMEAGTSYLGNNGGALAIGTMSMVNGVGWSVIDTAGIAGFRTPSIVVVGAEGEISAQDVSATRGLRVSGARNARFEGTNSGVPNGTTGIGYEIFVDGTRAYGQAYNRTSNAFVPLRFTGSQVEFAPGGTVKATLDATTFNLTGSLTATGTVAGSNLSGTNTGDQFTAMTTARLLGRVTAGTGVAEQLTAAQAKTMLAIATADVSGLAAVATSGSGADLVAGSVTYAKLQNASASRLIGNAAGTAGVPGEVGLGANLGFSGSNVQVQLAASAKLLGRTTAGAGATEEIGVANGITLAAGTLGLGSVTPTSVAASGAITSTGGGVGYATGAGGAVTQLTNKATAVTINKLAGQVTMHAASMAAGAIVEFTVNNSQVVATDTINLNLASGAASSIAYRYWVSAVGANLFKIAVENRSAGALGEALVFNFAAFKAVTA